MHNSIDLNLLSQNIYMINFTEAFKIINNGARRHDTFLSQNTGSIDGRMHVYSYDTRGSSLHTLGQILTGKNYGVATGECHNYEINVLWIDFITIL